MKHQLIHAVEVIAWAVLTGVASYVVAHAANMPTDKHAIVVWLAGVAAAAVAAARKAAAGELWPNAKPS